MSLLTWLGIACFLFVVAFTARAYQNDTGDGQTPRGAIVEAWMNIAIGFSINFAANLVLLPLMVDGHLSLSANFWGGWVYTSISIIRQYVIRRWFNKRLHAVAKKIARTA